MEDQLILVDEHDRRTGTAGKTLVHKEGLLHRAVSVFLVNSRGEWLLQQRHKDKYHSGGLWSNTCCSHPRHGEVVSTAARRRLKEEMGITCPLSPAFTFRYRIAFEDGMIEHEYDHVFTGVYDGDPDPHSEEVMDWKWISPSDLSRDVAEHPEDYTFWFRFVFERALEYCRGNAGCMERMFS